MKVLILCDHYPLSPRVKKVRESLITLYPKIEVNVFAWNRTNNQVKEDYVKTFDQNLGYGKKLKKLFNLVSFIRSAKKYVNDFYPDFIHAIDLEMLITSVLISDKKKVYEVYDIKFFKNKFINKVREKIEFYIIRKRVYKMVLASPYFDNYYRSNGINDTPKITINNKPSNKAINSVQSAYLDRYTNLLKDKLVIGFIGTIRYKEILNNLINASTKLSNVIILLAGGGPSYEYFKNYLQVNSLESKVIMTGRYETAELRDIYAVCDYVWAVYPNKDPNVKYAISNKYFESIVFHKKVIVAEDTLLGASVEIMNLGYTVNPYSVEKITTLLSTLEKDYDVQNQTVFANNLFWEDEEKELLKIYG